MSEIPGFRWKRTLSITCPVCQGWGEKRGEVCEACRGNGRVHASLDIQDDEVDPQRDDAEEAEYWREVLQPRAQEAFLAAWNERGQ